MKMTLSTRTEYFSDDFVVLKFSCRRFKFAYTFLFLLLENQHNYYYCMCTIFRFFRYMLRCKATKFVPIQLFFPTNPHRPNVILNIFCENAVRHTQSQEERERGGGGGMEVMKIGFLFFIPLMGFEIFFGMSAMDLLPNNV